MLNRTVSDQYWTTLIATANSADHIEPADFGALEDFHASGRDRHAPTSELTAGCLQPARRAGRPDLRPSK